MRFLLKALIVVSLLLSALSVHAAPRPYYRAQSSRAQVTREYLVRMGIGDHAAAAALENYDRHRNNPRLTNPNLLVIVDYTLPSYVARMFLVEMDTGKVESYLVTHGKGSGLEWVVRPSNELVTRSDPLGDNDSHRSPTGSFLTVETRDGGPTGHSRRLIGLDSDNANTYVPRYIYIHPKDGVNLEYKRLTGAVNRTIGCFGVDRPYARYVVDKVIDGTFMYVYWNQEDLNENMDRARQATRR